MSYHMRGWHPFPLWDTDTSVPYDQKNKGKKSPPKGVTGREGKNATRAQIEAWRDSGQFYNLGTRMPDNVVVVDVDAYHGGDKTLADLEAKLGKLPATHTVTARTDGSGHRYYLVPGKRVWQNPGAGIEILHWGWRYAVLPPSIHPETGTPYLWYGPRGDQLANQVGPKPDQLVPLPKAWIEFLDTGKDPNVTVPRVALDNPAVAALLTDWATDDEPCWHMRRALTNAMSSTTGGRHDSCMKAQFALLRYMEAGHPGGRTAMRMLRNWFFASLDGVRDPSSEWRRGVVNATERIAATPTEPGKQGCRPPSLFTTVPELTTSTRQVRTQTRRIETRSK